MRRKGECVVNFKTGQFIYFDKPLNTINSKYLVSNIIV